MAYFQKYSNPPHSGLALADDLTVAVRKFAELCHTSSTGGTSQRAKVPCIERYLESSGYHGQAFVIGLSAKGSPSSPSIADFRKYLKADYGVILHVGWFKFDPRLRAWRESGSHSLNAYGFDYDHRWGDEKILLKVANPGVNYLARKDKSFFDTVTLSQLKRKPGVKYPSQAKWVVRGPGFANSKRLPILEDVFVFSPDVE